MKIYKTLFWVTFIGGLVILLIGVYLTLSKSVTQGFITGKYSGFHQSSLNGYSELLLGVIMLLFSLWAYKIYKSQKKKYDKMR